MFNARRYTVIPTIKKFRCKHTAGIFAGKVSRKWDNALQLLALRKLALLDAALSVGQLRVPPGNRLGQYSIRINNQWRLCFSFENAQAYDVVVWISTEGEHHDDSY